MFGHTIVSMKTWDPTRAREIIEERGLTRKYIASRCKITRSYLNEVLTGKLPSDTLLVVLAMTLNTTVEDLCSTTSPSAESKETA